MIRALIHDGNPAQVAASESLKAPVTSQLQSVAKDAGEATSESPRQIIEKALSHLQFGDAGTAADLISNSKPTLQVPGMLDLLRAAHAPDAEGLHHVEVYHGGAGPTREVPPDIQKRLGVVIHPAGPPNWFGSVGTPRATLGPELLNQIATKGRGEARAGEYYLRTIPSRNMGQPTPFLWRGLHKILDSMDTPPTSKASGGSVDAPIPDQIAGPQPTGGGDIFDQVVGGLQQNPNHPVLKAHALALLRANLNAAHALNSLSGYGEGIPQGSGLAMMRALNNAMGGGNQGMTYQMIADEMASHGDANQIQEIAPMALQAAQFAVPDAGG